MFNIFGKGDRAPAFKRINFEYSGEDEPLQDDLDQFQDALKHLANSRKEDAIEFNHKISLNPKKKKEEKR